jgi:hypothetical protein
MALTIAGGGLEEPVWCDTITGGVYEIPKDNVKKSEAGISFKDIPVYDAPALIADKSMLEIVPWKAE